MKTFSKLSILALALIFAGCDSDSGSSDGETAAAGTIGETAIAAGTFETLVAAVQATSSQRLVVDELVPHAQIKKLLSGRFEF